MMTTTHIALGMSLAYGMVALFPDLATVVIGVAIIASIFPDVDVLFEHRKTLHFPAFYFLAALPVGALVAVRPTTVPVALLTFLLFAGVHSISDIFGGGAEARPWEVSSRQAVYLHLSRRWIPPNWGVRYDGSPEDLVLVILFSLPAFFVYDGALFYLLVVNLGISFVYTVFRKQVPDFFPA